jgi:hypothetical protein
MGAPYIYDISHLSVKDAANIIPRFCSGAVQVLFLLE